MKEKMKLIIKGTIKMLSGLILLGILLFLPAGTWHFAGAWRMITVLFAPMLLLGTGLLIFNPKLLAKRLNQKESEAEQKGVILLSTIVFIASFLLCGLDFKYGWSSVPHWLIITACVVFIATYLGFTELLRENEYLSRTVEIQEGQKVVSTGLYGIVRHPMYAIIFWMFLAMPIIIGSFTGLIPMVLLPFILVKRIINEEAVLRRELDGYDEYTLKVRYRMIPFVW